MSFHLRLQIGKLPGRYPKQPSCDSGVTTNQEGDSDVSRSAVPSSEYQFKVDTKAEEEHSEEQDQATVYGEEEEELLTLKFPSTCLDDDETDLEFGDDNEGNVGEAGIAIDDCESGRASSRFFCVEQMRYQLEEALGIETLLKCYNAVEVRHTIFHRKPLRIITNT